jgi:putative ABC transport system permease protein
MLRELIFAARTLRRSPVFTVTAALTIALGIGASTAIFSVANAVLLRPLPYKDPDRLVVLYADLRARNNLGMPVSAENYIDLKNGSMAAFEDMAAMGIGGRAVLAREDGTPEQVRFGRVTTNFFRVMGATIVLGRDFEEADGMAPPATQTAGAPVQAPQLLTLVILSYEYWQRRFGGDPAVISGSRLGDGPPGVLRGDEDASPGRAHVHGGGQRPETKHRRRGSVSRRQGFPEPVGSR